MIETREGIDDAMEQVWKALIQMMEGHDPAMRPHLRGWVMAQLAGLRHSAVSAGHNALPGIEAIEAETRDTMYAMLKVLQRMLDADSDAAHPRSAPRLQLVSSEPAPGDG